MKIICFLALLLTLSACATRGSNSGITTEEDTLLKSLALLMSGMSYDMACNGKSWESYKNFKNPDNVRLSKNRKVIISRLQYLWERRHPELATVNGMPYFYLVAGDLGDKADKAIRAAGCSSKEAKDAEQSLLLFAKSDPEAINATMNQRIAREGGFVTAVPQ